MGSAVSAIAATGLFAIVLRNDDMERIQSEVVSAHLRSAAGRHLTDGISTDQHTVNRGQRQARRGPPVIDSPHRALPGRRPARLRRRRPIGAVVYRRASTSSICRGADIQARTAQREDSKRMQGFNLTALERPRH